MGTTASAPDETSTTSVSSGASGVVLVLLAGAAVALSAGAYGRAHDPTGQATISLFFSNTLAFKVWLATGILTLVLFQLYSALRLYGRVTFPATLPKWFGDAHRLSGTVILIASLPIAYHCLWSLGFEPDIAEPRRLAHSLMGCAFYGAFTTKVLVVRNHSLPGWVLPAMGGTVFTMLVGLWLTSSLWYFTNIAFPGF